MTGIKADWQLSALADLPDDPFDTVVLSTGLTVDLTGSKQEIEAGLSRSLQMEGALFSRGITCELKDGGQDCLTCTSYTSSPEEPRSRLCLLGRDQRMIEKAHDVCVAPLREIADRAEDWSEAGHLTPEYAELLTAVGL